MIFSKGQVEENDVTIRKGNPDRDNSDLPPECHDDLDVVQYRLTSDPKKKITRVLIDRPTEEKGKNYYMEEIETHMTQTLKQGVLIWYLGHGGSETGSWCFRGGRITFTDVFRLYRQLCRNKLLTLVIDCPYAGNWGLSCAEEFDRMGIPACGHQAKSRGYLVKVFSSCCRDQIARELNYSVDAVRFKEDSLYFFAEKLAEGQRPFHLDFTKITCGQKPNAKCKATADWRWKDLLSGNLSQRCYLVRGKDRGQAAWHYVMLRDDESVKTQFLERTQGGNLDVANYGQVLVSGWGGDPPKYIKSLLPQF